MRPLGIILLAAGLGKRMKSDLPKVLHRLGGRPLISYPLRIAQGLEPERVVVVVGNGAEEVRQSCGEDGITWVTQQEQLGTGHAVRCAGEVFSDFRGDLLILSGDVPFVTHRSLAERIIPSGLMTSWAMVLTLKKFWLGNNWGLFIIGAIILVSAIYMVIEAVQIMKRGRPPGEKVPVGARG